MTPVATSTPSADSSADAARRAAARLAAARKATAARKAAARAAAARAVARQRAKRQAALRAAAARRAAAVRAEAARRKAAARRRAAASAANCTPGYSPCVPVASDVDCAGGSGDGPVYVEGPIRVTGDDPYDLDRDGDGIACEDG